MLETPDAVVSDSTAILRWLEHAGARAAAVAGGARRRGPTTDIAIDWFNEVWKRAPNAIDDELLRPHPDADRDRRAGSREIQATLPWFEALLDGRDFLLGDTLGAFDVVRFPFLKYGVVVPDAGDAEPFHWILHEHLRERRRAPAPRRLDRARSTRCPASA